MESGKIYESMGAVMKKITPIDKNKKNTAQNFDYRGIDDFMNELHGLFAENGIIVIPSEREHIQDTFEVEKVTNGKVEKKLQFRSRVHVYFKFMSTADGSTIEADGWGEAADNGDKGYNKCKSIALKYVLMQMFVIPTKEIKEPDGESPDDVSPREDPNLELALQLVKEANDIPTLQEVWRDNKGYQSNKRFYNAVQARKDELSSK